MFKRTGLKVALKNIFSLNSPNCRNDKWLFEQNILALIKRRIRIHLSCIWVPQLSRDASLFSARASAKNSIAHLTFQKS